ncbi:hypothetical protein TSUD_139570 [Trifolium subterraneum]|uniref:RNase H type-1 domain-containing protein n=1 Tax=Trifolium subterraneum TaxID=3900 RepID=A0A2Z6P0B2_TRISU|nr:hypothetical protein TSUD_139570 [Trifolium subterraneum]
MLNNTEKDSCEIIVAITYGIWYARNAAIFQNKILTPIEVCNTALAQLHEYQAFSLELKITQRPLVTRNSSNNNSWCPPLRGTLKINVDAHLSSDGRWFSGMVLRRSDGSAVGAATRVHIAATDVVLGESCEVKRHHSQSLGFRCVSLQSVSKRKPSS